jgi:fumarate reductase flavoprotein subunit
MHYLGLRHMMGEGLLMAIEAGAATEGLGILMLHPHFFPGEAYVNAISQEPYTVLVNKYGERFVDEALSFNPTECGNAVDRQPDKCVYALFDERIKRMAMEEGTFKGSIEEAVGSYTGGTKATTTRARPTDAGTKLLNLDKKLQSEADKGGVKISDSWDEIAGWIGVAPKVLKATIEEYNSFCDYGYDKIFVKDRRYLQALRTPPYYAARCYLSFLVTIGGIKINQNMEVLGHNDKPIPGLYAGGDSAGGWETDTYNIILSGSACGFAVNSGRIAGENAATNVLAK